MTSKGKHITNCAGEWRHGDVVVNVGENIIDELAAIDSLYNNKDILLYNKALHKGVSVPRFFLGEFLYDDELDKISTDSFPRFKFNTIQELKDKGWKNISEMERALGRNHG